MPTKEAKEDDAHDATQDTNEDHHALAKKKKTQLRVDGVQINPTNRRARRLNFAMEFFG